jgi:hypothetical protein
MAGQKRRWDKVTIRRRSVMSYLFLFVCLALLPGIRQVLRLVCNHSEWQNGPVSNVTAESLQYLERTSGLASFTSQKTTVRDDSSSATAVFCPICLDLLPIFLKSDPVIRLPSPSGRNSDIKRIHLHEERGWRFWWRTPVQSPIWSELMFQLQLQSRSNLPLPSCSLVSRSAGDMERARGREGVLLQRGDSIKLAPCWAVAPLIDCYYFSSDFEGNGPLKARYPISFSVFELVTSTI